MIKTLLLLLLASNAQAYYYFPYSFSELEAELSNLSGGVIQAKFDLPAEARKTDFQKIGVGFYTWHNPSRIDPQDYFSIDIAKFNQKLNAPDFLTAKINYYSRLGFSHRSQRHFRAYAYLESWRSLFHPQIKTIDIDRTVFDQDMTPIKFGDRAAANSPYFNSSLHREVDAISGSELTSGNDLDLLLNNDSFEHKLDLIRRAKKSFLGIVMVLSCDRNGTRMVDELINAKNRGVDVKMMHEEVWTNIINGKCVKRMRDAGIDVLLPSDMISNHFALGVVHNKFWIRDEEEAIIGGQNMVDAETEATGFNHKMHDSDVWIHSGPEVTTLLYQYGDIWNRYAKGDQKARISRYFADAEARKVAEREQGVRGSQNYDAWFDNPAKRMKGVCRSVVQKYGKVDLIGPVLQKYAEQATSRILASTPNVKYHNNKRKPVINNLLNALTDRAKHGVKIDVISNGIDGASGAMGDTFRDAIRNARRHVNTLWQIPVLKFLYRTTGLIASKGDGKEFARLQNSSPNIRAWTHSGGIHAKQMVMDRTMVAVGSFNLDHNSASTNHEAEIFCLDEKLANQIEDEFTIDLANSVPLPR